MNREFPGCFDKLHFSESVIGALRVEGGRLHVPIRSVFVLAGHPLQANGDGPYEGELIFDGVIESRKTVTEYIGDSRRPAAFRPPMEVVDEVAHGSRSSEMTGIHEFGFEGYQESPSAWIDNWIVRARSFAFLVKTSGNDILISS